MDQKDMVRREELAQTDGGDDGDRTLSSQRHVRQSRQRSSIPGKYHNSAADAAMMGGLNSESKVADLRMWLAGASTSKGGGSFQKAGASVIDNLPYALPIVAACLLVMVIIAVRILRKTQPQSTSYINAALNNVKGGFSGKNSRRY